MKKWFYIAAAFLTSCHHETVYSDYKTSPVKSAEVSPLFFPAACSDGSVVTLTSENDTLNYNFVKVNRNGDKTETSFSLTWNEARRGGENLPASKQSQGGMPQTKIDISDGNMRANANDEFYFEFYSSNNFGRSYYAVVKFDKNGQKLFQLDSTVSMNGGGMNGGQNTASVSKVPVGGTPLDNGGYAMIFQVLNQGMVQHNTSYGLTMRYITPQGVTGSEKELSFDETISITSVNSVKNNVFIHYTNSDGYNFLRVFSLDGTLITDKTVDYEPYIFIPDKNCAYISGTDSEGACALSLDSLGNETIRISTDNAFFANAVNADGVIYFAGMEISGSAVSSVSSLIKAASSMTGVLAAVSEDGKTQKQVKLDYDDGIACFAFFNDGKGGYDVFLTRISTETAVNMNMSNTFLGHRIYVYNVSSLEKLQIN